MMMLLAAGLIVLLIAADQWIKAWAVGTLAHSDPIILIKGVLQFSYVENYGGAFGIFQGKALALAVITAVFLAGLAGSVFYFGFKKKYVLMWILAGLSGGGIGNLIDRFHRGFVVDYIYFSLIDFPVFNFADCCVVIGTFALMAYIFLTDRAAERAKGLEKKKTEKNDTPPAD